MGADMEMMEMESDFFRREIDEMVVGEWNAVGFAEWGGIECHSSSSSFLTWHLIRYSLLPFLFPSFYHCLVSVMLWHGGVGVKALSSCSCVSTV
ncbi:hypothetical protein L873DRAFT_1051215 [Choiromyces venosus 120613-1]|uniref:Uncharacterized protein n=1 Tax=Choiromyces venosus 120613-1 TaxID=1336337 RepID=A0A3N4JIK6_9PEZI|nr:hypothetical protein L873DRAFT_1051215 [Choiromyces venosus 120613-1]